MMSTTRCGRPSHNGNDQEDPSRRDGCRMLMERFASRTGLLSSSSSSSSSVRLTRRYLWTDAFAVCNLLGLASTSSSDGERRGYERLAETLISTVHDSLGRFRSDDPDPDRRGTPLAAASYAAGGTGARGPGPGPGPTAGGLRIGKKLPERTEREPYDDRLEWDRDGQYFHYLTKWMTALERMDRYYHVRRCREDDDDGTGTHTAGRQDDGTTTPSLSSCSKEHYCYNYRRWGLELARVAANKFVSGTTTGGRSSSNRMYWKMSTDLSRPLVPSMGAQDPLDGYVTLSELLAVRPPWLLSRDDSDGQALWKCVEKEREVFRSMTKVSVTDDPLGIGGMLVDAYRLHEMQKSGIRVDGDILDRLWETSLRGLMYYVGGGGGGGGGGGSDLDRPAERRLAFRELGLSIGLHAARRALFEEEYDDDEEEEDDFDHDRDKDGAQQRRRRRNRDHHRARRVLLAGRFRSYIPDISERIESFWLDPQHQKARAWKGHLDINEVMLATSLQPDGFLSGGDSRWSGMRVSPDAMN